MLPTIEWQDDAVVMIDQRKLPAAEVYVRCRTAAEVARAIKTMVIRGAPAIGVAAAMGIALGDAAEQGDRAPRQFAAEFQKTCDLMAATRPTAVNLFWAIDRMKRRFAAAAQAGRVGRRDQATGSSARRARSTTRTSRAAARWARSAPSSCRDGARILTHCNAGALATAGYGTALGVIRGAVEAGKQVAVFADETRPFLQGARLTAWELVRDGIDTTVITDNMAGALMRAGPDRPGRRRRRPHRGQRRRRQQDRHLPRGRARARSTASRSTSRRRSRRSTWPRRTARAFPIEERAAPRGDARRADAADARRRARSATRRSTSRRTRYITAIITERGICRAPFAESLRRVVSQG